jgi:hypothetical protein
MQILERWTFERLDERHFRPSPGNPDYPHFILEISRPSVGVPSAWVHAGGNPAPLIGSGATHVWLRQEGGTWVESQDIVARWIT